MLGGVVRANTDACELCQSEGLTEYMETDSEALMQEGVATAPDRTGHGVAFVWEKLEKYRV